MWLLEYQRTLIGAGMNHRSQMTRNGHLKQRWRRHRGSTSAPGPSVMMSPSVAHVVIQISDDVLDDVSNRDHATNCPRPALVDGQSRAQPSLPCSLPVGRPARPSPGRPSSLRPTGVCFASSRQQHFMAQSPWVTIPTRTSSSMTSTDRPGCRASGARLRRPCRRNEHGSGRHSGPERL